LPESCLVPVHSAFKAFHSAVRESVAAVESATSGTEGAARRSFAERLVVRLLFLKFVEQFGWLDGDSDYLFGRFRHKPDSFLTGLLRPLLARFSAAQSARHESGSDLGLVPEARGLFTPTGPCEDDQVTVAEHAFQIVFERLLSRFEFGTLQRGPMADPDVIGPDSMGTAYEGLIADRHGKGAYYTSTAEVDLMCRESLHLFLTLRCPGVPDPVIASLASACDGKAGPRPGPAKDGALALCRALSEISVCDPAVGAGAFPVAMMRHLLGALRLLGDELQGDRQFEEGIATGELADPGDRFGLKAHLVQRCLHGCDIDPAAIEITRMRLWLELVGERDSPDQFPDFRHGFAVGEALAGGAREETEGWFPHLEDPVLPGCVNWGVDFPEVFQHAEPGFDIVIGNPPYVRKEEIEPLYRELGIPLSKKDLQRAYRSLFGETVSGHADLYLYFYLRGLSLLKHQDGVLCYITPNAWLDVGYGRVLQKVLIERTRLAAIIENRAARSFAGADVNTAIVLCSTGATDDGADNRVCFVAARKNFGQGPSDGSWQSVLSGVPGAGPQESPSARVIPIRQRDLADEIRAVNAGALSGKWGGRFLRAPSALHGLLSELEFRPLSEFAQVVTYLNTGGCDDLFFVKVQERAEGRVKIASQAHPEESFWVESRFVVPLVRSPSALPKPLIREEELEHYLLRIPEDTEVAPLAVSDYLEWGKAKGFTERTGSRRRSPWWKLPIQAFEGYPILISRHHHDRFNVFHNPDRVVANSFYGLVPREDACSCEALLAYLSSTLGVLLAEIYGRTNQGQGVLNTYGEDLEAVPVFRDVLASKKDWRSVLSPYLERASLGILEDCGYRAAPEGGGALAPTPERKAVDDAVFDCLGVEPELRDEIVLATCRVVEERLLRAARKAR